MRITLIAVGLAAALAACQTGYRYQGNEQSPFYAVPVGSRLILNQDLSFGPSQVSLYVQNGKILRLSEVHKYSPFCKFELFHRVDAARTIAPDEINVTKVLQEHSSGTFSQTGQLHYARLSLQQLAQSGNGDQQGGGSPESFTVRMDLRSEKQPEVFRMTCGRWSFYPSTYIYPSISEIRRTLNPLFTLRTPAEG
jgi:hypothetical protein